MAGGRRLTFAEMPAVPCSQCGGPTVERSSDYLDLSGPTVAVRDVPALACARCGTAYLPAQVLRRLCVIVDEALDLGERTGLPEIRWAYTRCGPADVGGLPSNVRGFFDGLWESLDHERSLAEATERAGYETPSSLH